MKNPISITLAEETWIGLLFHLKDTVENIPVSIIEPDPWICVTEVIATVEDKLPETK